jgi:hypothetical protein
MMYKGVECTGLFVERDPGVSEDEVRAVAEKLYEMGWAYCGRRDIDEFFQHMSRQVLSFTLQRGDGGEKLLWVGRFTENGSRGIQKVGFREFVSDILEPNSN